MDSTIQHNEAKPKKVESGKDYSDDPIRSGGLNNGASISRRLLENATKTKDGDRINTLLSKTTFAFCIFSGLITGCYRCLTHEAEAEAWTGGHSVQVQGGRPEAAGQDCPSRRLSTTEEAAGLSEDWCRVNQQAPHRCGVYAGAPHQAPHRCGFY